MYIVVTVKTITIEELYDYKLVLFMLNLLFYFFNFCLSGTKYGYRCLQQNIRPFYTIKFFSNYFTWDLCVSVN